jgi:rod shape-determining protein MreC
VVVAGQRVVRRGRRGSAGKRIVAAVGAVGLLVLLGALARMGVLRDVTAAILSPPQSLFRFLISGARMGSENARLRDAAARLALENFALREAELENVRLRTLLDFKAASWFQLEPAAVLARDAGRFGRALKISKGRGAGLGVNMPVVNHEGLVGKVIEVDAGSSFVQILRDPDCRVSALVQRSRVAGILAWDPREGVRLLDVPHHADVEVGDLIVTSGLGEIFPKGILVGRVESVTFEEAHLFRRIEVEPFVDFSHLEEVFVITGLVDREPQGPRRAWGGAR